MSAPIDRFARKQPWKPRGKGPGGRNLCYCGCGREVAPPRRTCFSDECLIAYRRHSDAQTIRRIVEERDRGVCAKCGVDANLQRKQQLETVSFWRWLARRHAEELFKSGQLIDPLTDKPEIAYGDIYSHSQRMVRGLVEEYGWNLDGHTWEADHIIPVVEGGGGCGPEGYRTLCLACHKQETAALAARRAKQRREAKRIPELNLL